MHAGQQDHLGIHFYRFARQGQAVADDVRDAVENFRRLVVVRQDHRVALVLEVQDGVDVVGEDRPLDGGDGTTVLDALVERGGACQGGGWRTWQGLPRLLICSI